MTMTNAKDRGEHYIAQQSSVICEFLYSGWPLSRNCKIPGHFPDNTRHSCPRQMVLI